jgi:hypothetical protein
MRCEWSTRDESQVSRPLQRELAHCTSGCKSEPRIVIERRAVAARYSPNTARGQRSLRIHPIEHIEEPSGSCQCSPGLRCTLAQRPIGGNKCHRTAGFGNHGEKVVIAAAWSVQDGDAVGCSRLDAAPELTLEDHDDGFGEQISFRHDTDPLHEFPSGSRAILPPAGGTRSDHIRGIHQKHQCSLARSSRRPTAPRIL